MTRSAKVSALVAAIAIVVASLVAPGSAAAAGCPTVAVDGTVTPAPGPAVVWEGCDLSGADLHGADLSAASLLGARLIGADLSGALLLGTQLNFAALDGADLTDATVQASMIKARMVGATVAGAHLSTSVLTSLAARDLVGTPAALPTGWRLVRGALLGPTAVVNGVDLAGADLTGADLTGAYINASSLAGADLTDATMTDARLTAVAVDGVTLDGATMTRTLGVNLTGQPAPPGPGAATWTVEAGYLVGPKANLSRARLAGTDLSGRDLQGVVLTDAVLTDVDLRGSSLKAAKLDGLVLTRAKVDGLDLTGLVATSRLRAEQLVGEVAALPRAGWRQTRGMLLGPGVELLEPDLSGLDLVGVDFSGSVLYYPDFTDSDLTSVDLGGAYLWAATFRRSSLAGATLNGYLQQSQVVESDVRGADLAGLYLVGTVWGGSDLTGANISGATVINTLWLDAICPDGVIANVHVKQDCLQAVDQTAPRVTLSTLPRFWTSFLKAPMVTATVVDVSEITQVDWAGTIQVYDGSKGPFPIYTDVDDQGRHIGLLGSGESTRICAKARATDTAGNVGAWSAQSCTTGLTDVETLTWSAGWKQHTANSYWNLSYESTSRKGATLTSPYRKVRELGVVAATCPTCGSIALYVGSSKVGSINLARSTVKSRALITLPRFSSAKYGKVRLVVTSGSASTVKIDALAITAY